MQYGGLPGASHGVRHDSFNGGDRHRDRDIPSLSYQEADQLPVHCWLAYTRPTRITPLCARAATWWAG